MDEAERKVLSMVEQGQISPDEGLKLINAMAADENEAKQERMGEVGSDVLDAQQHPIPQEELERTKRLKRWWILPFGIGLLITTLGAVWMFDGYMNNGFGAGFWLAWLPFILGIFILALSFQSSRRIWVHVRIKQKPGERPERISISLPLPLKLAKWGLTTFGHKVPGLRDHPIDGFNEILESLSPEDPFYVHVKDDDGEEVEVFIG
ncbi:MAG: hypothetical protein SVR81_06935 [Chloroflexota bacterium]|nr:hypothetical protein [Chloroflexota bacterium]